MSSAGIGTSLDQCWITDAWRKDQLNVKIKRKNGCKSGPSVFESVYGYYISTVAQSKFFTPDKLDRQFVELEYQFFTKFAVKEILVNPTHTKDYHFKLIFFPWFYYYEFQKNEWPKPECGENKKWAREDKC